MNSPQPGSGDLSEEQLALLRDSSIFSGGVLQTTDRAFIPVSCVANGRKAVVWQVVDRRGRRYAAKIALAEDYASPDRGIEDEFRLRLGLQPPLFTTCEDVGAFTAEGMPEAFVVIVEQWVDDGFTLQDLVEKRSDEITTATIMSFALQMTDVLDALEREQLEHDDLHARNIMLRPSRPGEVAAHDPAGAGFQLVVVDTGSLKPTSATKKKLSDVDHIAHHIAVMHNVVRRRRDLSLDDRRLLHLLEPLLNQMTDDDAGRSIRTGAEIREALRVVARDATLSLGGRQELKEPFELINAEQIRNDELLLDLFAETTWLSQLTSGDAVLLTGPRGCGKSMVLRWLALRTHASVDRRVPMEDLHVSGIYVSCASDVQTRLSAFQTRDDVDGMEEEIVFFFNLLHILELVRTLGVVAQRGDAQEVFGLGKDEAARIYELIEKHLTPAAPTVRFNPNPLASATHLVERELFRSQRRLHERKSAPSAPVTLIGDVTADLVQIMPFFQAHPIAFLLDDFSTHRVSEAVQELVFNIVWGRQPSHHFKVSSEKYGTVNSWSGLTSDPDRERIEIDCGAEFLDDTKAGYGAPNKRFIQNLLDRRLKAAGWVGTAQELIGDSLDHKAMNANLRASGKLKATYYGLDVLAMLCSGDIAALLMLYRRILSKSNKTSRKVIAARAQHNAVEEVSRLLLNAVVHHRPLGDRLLMFAREFGTFVGAALQDGKGIREHSQIVPVEIPRIEVESNLGMEQELPGGEFELIKELLRRSVFIELTLGRSRHSRLSTLRWHFRRIYLPVFRAGLYKNDAVKISPQQFQLMLEQPKLILEPELEKRRRAVVDPAQEQPSDVQLTLFDGEGLNS